MGAKSKAGRPRKTALKRSVRHVAARKRSPPPPDAWEQDLTQAADDELDCQRIVAGDDSRISRLYYDDYN